MRPVFEDLGEGKEARIAKLKLAVPEFNDVSAERALRSYARLAPAAAIANAMEAATGPGVRSPVGLAISVVKKAAGR